LNRASRSTARTDEERSPLAQVQALAPEEVVIEATGLRMSYDGLQAVRGIDLRVRRGEIFAFLGPNGAGKTTTVEILEGHRTRTGGDARVLGIDPAHADGAWRGRVGVNGEGMTVTFADRPDGGTRVQISGAVSGGSLELASDPEAWSEALGVTPPA
jgi:ABC-type molybdenum transport system ATPase subunit/photorepair protein PhrA